MPVNDLQQEGPTSGWLRGSLGAFPMKALTLGIAATLVFLTLISLGTSRAYRALQEFSTHELRLQALIGRIVHLDEVLTMSARMAAATGELHWEERYHAFEPELDAAIEEAVRLASESYAAYAADTESANRELVAMERRAFALVRDGRREEAAAILFSAEYEEGKSVYAAGMQALTAAIEERSSQERQGHRQEVWQAWTLAVVSAVLLLMAWVGVVGLIRKHLAEHTWAEEERRLLEAKMQQAQKLESLGVLAGGIAHDFNNLLTTILGNSRVVLAELETGSPQRERIGRVCTAAEYAAELVDQILAYSGKPSVNLEPLDLSRLIADMGALLQTSVTGRCELRLECAGELPAVEADATQIRQVILNLVTNASEAAADGGAIVTLRTGVTQRSAADLRDCLGTETTPGQYVYLEVSDSGTGMDVATQARIFEPFFTKKSFGRGLGLAAVIGIVRAHRGALEVESHPGEGTRIRALFPQADRPALEPFEPGEPTPAVRGSGRILVVDDEEWVLEIAKVSLERAGFEVCTALGGHRGIELFKAESCQFDAVVLDLAMPEVAGDEVFTELKKLRAGIPVIAVSGYSEEVAAERFGNRDFGAFVRKPYEPEHLVETVRSAIGTSVAALE
jgi:signal transduction histidine kinase/CheY-like chemotaxis protein